MLAPPPAMTATKPHSASSSASNAFSAAPPSSSSNTQYTNEAASPAAAAAAAAAAPTSASFAIETHHEDIIHDMQMDFYGTKLATCSSDRTIKVFNVSSSSTDGSAGSYELVATLQGHEGPVWQVSWAHPKFGVLLASCSFDGSVWVHRESRPREWTVIHAARQLHESSVNGVAFGPEEYGDNMILAAASSDGRVSVLEHNPVTQMWTVDYINDCPMGVNAVSWAPGNAFDFQLGGQQQQQSEDQPQTEQPSSTCALALVTAGCDNGIRFWQRSDTMMGGSGGSSVGEWTQENVPQCATDGLKHRDWVRDVAWAPSPLIPNHNRVASCGEDGQVLMWTLENDGSGSVGWRSTLVHEFDEPVWRVSWSTTGLVLAVSSGDSTVTLWKEALAEQNKWVRMEQKPVLGTTQQQQPPPQPGTASEI
ncbi:hypothetical protein ACA910_002444 [Epithemia clementina (nom. ined.)]